MSVTDPAGWLTDDPVVERVALDDQSWIDVVRNLLPRPAQVFADLHEQVSWVQGRVFRYERWIDEPRLGGWQGGDDTHPALVAAQHWVTRRYGTPFDGVALALYRDQRDSVAWHRDRELRYLDDTVIAVLSLGATRSFLVRPLGARRVSSEDDDGRDVLDFRPSSGDLLVMGGACQARWLHAVPKSGSPKRARISAQWRWTSGRGRRDPNPSYYAPRHFSR